MGREDQRRARLGRTSLNGGATYWQRCDVIYIADGLLTAACGITNREADRPGNRSGFRQGSCDRDHSRLPVFADRRLSCGHLSDRNRGRWRRKRSQWCTVSAALSG